MKEESKFNPWPYGLSAALITFCVIQFSLVSLASSSFEGLDDVEYYRHGVEYGQELERQERQKDLGWTVAHNLEKATTASDSFPLRVAVLDYDQKPVMKAKLHLKVGRPATLRADRSYELKEVGPGIYAGDVSLGAGSWRFDLEAEKGKNLVKVEFRHKVAEPSAPGPEVGAL